MTGTPGRGRAFDLPAAAFPFTADLIDVDSGTVVWSVTADGPGVIKIPGKVALGVREVAVRIRYADGTVTDSRDER